MNFGSIMLFLSRNKTPIQCWSSAECSAYSCMVSGRTFVCVVCCHRSLIGGGGGTQAKWGRVNIWLYCSSRLCQIDVHNNLTFTSCHMLWYLNAQPVGRHSAASTLTATGTLGLVHLPFGLESRPLPKAGPGWPCTYRRG